MILKVAVFAVFAVFHLHPGNEKFLEKRRSAADIKHRKHRTTRKSGETRIPPNYREDAHMTTELRRHLDQAAAALDTATTMQEYATAIIQSAYWKTELDRQEASA